MYRSNFFSRLSQFVSNVYSCNKEFGEKTNKIYGYKSVVSNVARNEITSERPSISDKCVRRIQSDVILVHKKSNNRSHNSLIQNINNTFNKLRYRSASCSKISQIRDNLIENKKTYAGDSFNGSLSSKMFVNLDLNLSSQTLTSKENSNEDKGNKQCVKNEQDITNEFHFYKTKSNNTATNELVVKNDCELEKQDWLLNKEDSKTQVLKNDSKILNSEQTKANTKNVINGILKGESKNLNAGKSCNSNSEWVIEPVIALVKDSNLKNLNNHQNIFINPILQSDKLPGTINEIKNDKQTNKLKIKARSLNFQSRALNNLITVKHHPHKDKKLAKIKMGFKRLTLDYYKIIRNQLPTEQNCLYNATYICHHNFSTDEKTNKRYVSEKSLDTNSTNDKTIIRADQTIRQAVSLPNICNFKNNITLRLLEKDKMNKTNCTHKGTENDENSRVDGIPSIKSKLDSRNIANAVGPCKIVNKNMLTDKEHEQPVENNTQIKQSIKLIHYTAFKEIDTISAAWEREKDYTPDKLFPYQQILTEQDLTNEKNDDNVDKKKKNSTNDFSSKPKENKAMDQYKAVSWDRVKCYKREEQAFYNFYSEKVLKQNKIYEEQLKRSTTSSGIKTNKNTQPAVPWEQEKYYNNKSLIFNYCGNDILKHYKTDLKKIEQENKKKSNISNSTAVGWVAKKKVDVDKCNLNSLQSNRSDHSFYFKPKPIPILKKKQDSVQIGVNDHTQKKTKSKAYEKMDISSINTLTCPTQFKSNPTGKQYPSVCDTLKKHENQTADKNKKSNNITPKPDSLKHLSNVTALNNTQELVKNLPSAENANSNQLELLNEAVKNQADTKIQNVSTNKSLDQLLIEKSKSGEKLHVKVNSTEIFQPSNVIEYIELFKQAYDKEQSIESDKTVSSEKNLLSENVTSKKDAGEKLEPAASEDNETLKTLEKKDTTDSFLDSKLIMSINTPHKIEVNRDSITNYYKNKTKNQLFVKCMNQVAKFNVEPKLPENANFGSTECLKHISKKKLSDVQNEAVNKSDKTNKNDCIGCSVTDTADNNSFKEGKTETSSSAQTSNPQQTTTNCEEEKDYTEHLQESQNQLLQESTEKDDDINVLLAKIHDERIAELYEYEEKVLGIYPNSKTNKITVEQLLNRVNRVLPQNDSESSTSNITDSLANVKNNEINYNHRLIDANKFPQKDGQTNFEENYIIYHSGDNASVTSVNSIEAYNKEGNVTFGKKPNDGGSKNDGKGGKQASYVKSDSTKKKPIEHIKGPRIIKDTIRQKEKPLQVSEDEKCETENNKSVTVSSKKPISITKKQFVETYVSKPDDTPETEGLKEKISYYHARIKENMDKAKEPLNEVSAPTDFVKIIQNELRCSNSNTLQRLENSVTINDEIKKYMPSKISKFMLNSLFNTIFNDDDEEKEKIEHQINKIQGKELSESVTVENNRAQKVLSVINEKKFPMVNFRKFEFDYPITNQSVVLADFNENIRYNHIASVSKVLNETLPCKTKRALYEWETDKLKNLGKSELYKFYQDQLKNDVQFHDCIRRHIMGTPLKLLMENAKAETKGCMKSLQHVFDKIENVSVLESPVVHSVLPYYGIVDCIGCYKGEPVVIEWKQSDSSKSLSNSEMTLDAPVQLAAYVGAINYDGQYKFPVKSGLIVVAFMDGSPAEIHTLSTKKCETYWKLWLSRLSKFMASKA